MIFTNWLDLKTRVQAELDIRDETFIDSAELLIYAKKAIDTAANIIINLYEDYFLVKSTITLVSGQSDYSLPTDIFAQKIRRVIYDNGQTKYAIKRIKNLDETAQLTQAGYQHKYIITNSLTNGFKMSLFPTPVESGGYLTLWYLRNVSQIALDADVIDLPEAHHYIMTHIKDSCLNKERGSLNAAPSAELKEQERLLVEALTCRTPDDDNTIEPDISFYQGVN
jgi:hypothetical protein